jgi:hypothetical protein
MPSRIGARATGWPWRRVTCASRGNRGRPAGGRADHGAEFVHVERNPAQALAKGEFRWKQQGGRDLALYALERAARVDAAGVRAAWEKQRGRLTEADRLYGNGRIAIMRRASSTPGLGVVSRSRGARRCPTRSASGGYVRRCVPAPGPMSSRRSMRCRLQKHRNRLGDTGRRARCRRRTAPKGRDLRDACR